MADRLSCSGPAGYSYDFVSRPGRLPILKRGINALYQAMGDW